MAASSSAGHGFRGVSQKPNGKWDAQKVLNLDGKRKNLHNGQTHGTAEEAAHAFDCMLYFLEDEPDYNLPQKMTPSVKDELARHRDVFEYLEVQKKLFDAKQDAGFRKGTSKFRGVSLDNRSHKWRSNIRINGKQIQQQFETEEEAAHDYDRRAIRRDGRAAKLNFPLESYAGEFSEAELDAIDARVAAGKPPPATGAAAKGKAKASSSKGKAAAKPARRRGSTSGAAGAAAAAAVAAGEASGSGSGAAAEDSDGDGADWEEEEEVDPRSDPSSWTPEQRAAYKIVHPFDDMFTEEELDELAEDVERLHINDDFEDFKQQKRAEFRREREERVAHWAALLEEVRGTADEPYVEADLEQVKRELARVEEDMPSSDTMWRWFEAEEMKRYSKFLKDRVLKYPLTFQALESEGSWFHAETMQPDVNKMTTVFQLLEADLRATMERLQDDDEKDAYVVKMLRIRRFLDTQGIGLEGMSAEELVQLRWALGRDQDEEEEDPEEAFGVFDTSDAEDEEVPPIPAFPADFSRGTVEGLLAGIVDATHGIFERAENGPAAAVGLPSNAPASARFAPPATAAPGLGAAPAASDPTAGPAPSGAAAAAAPLATDPAAAARTPGSSAAPASVPAFAFVSGAAPPTSFGGFGASASADAAAPPPRPAFAFGSGAASPSGFGGFATSGGSGSGGSAEPFSFGSGAAPPATFGGFGTSGGSSSAAAAGASAFGAAAPGSQPAGAFGASTSGGANPAAAFSFPPYPGTAAGGDASSSGGGGGGGGGAGSSAGPPPAPSGWLNLESYGAQAAADPQVRADWHYQMQNTTPTGPGGQFSEEDYARMLANLLRQERNRQAQGHLPGWNGAPDIRREEEQEAAAEAEEEAWQQEKAAIEARMAELQREGNALIRHVDKYTFDVERHMNNAIYLAYCTYWEGQCMAHLKAGHTEWLEEVVGEGWQERVRAVGVTKPHFYGTHDWRDSLPPRLPPYEQILLEMTGCVSNTAISRELGELLGQSLLPVVDDATLAIWFQAICDQARLGLPTIGLAPVEKWAPGCAKWNWRAEMKAAKKKFTGSHPWIFLNRMRPVRLGVNYPPGTPDVVRPSVQQAMREAREEPDAIRLRAAEEVAEAARLVAEAAEAGVRAGRMSEGVAPGRS